MKKLSLTAALFCLFLTGAAFAQTDKAGAANFAGTWHLDTAKSKFGERMRVESGTLTVTQTEKQLTVATDFKRARRGDNPPPPAPPAGENGGMRPEGNRGGMRGGGAMMGGGNESVTYNLNGLETIRESETPAGEPSIVVRLKVETLDNGKLKITSNRTATTQMGAMTIKNVETWELLDDGATLKITRETETPRGSQTAEMYFTRRAAGEVSVQPAFDAVQQTPVGNDNSDGAQNSSAKTIDAGVINGRATSLPQPDYPPAARAVNASGAVKVQVTLDEQGNVIAASAVSGHPLLKAAAEKAARSATFSPTRLSGTPIKVTGIIVYNFVL